MTGWCRAWQRPRLAPSIEYRCSGCRKKGCVRRGNPWGQRQRCGQGARPTHSPSRNAIQHVCRYRSNEAQLTITIGRTYTLNSDATELPKPLQRIGFKSGTVLPACLPGCLPLTYHSLSNYIRRIFNILIQLCISL